MKHSQIAVRMPDVSHHYYLAYSSEVSQDGTPLQCSAFAANNFNPSMTGTTQNCHPAPPMNMPYLGVQKHALHAKYITMFVFWKWYFWAISIFLQINIIPRNLKQQNQVNWSRPSE